MFLVRQLLEYVDTVDIHSKLNYALGLEVGVTAVVRNNRRRQNT